ncbi:MAG: aminoglycoside phosphotransferase family protein [Caldilineaceae bacterium]
MEQLTAAIYSYLTTSPGSNFRDRPVTVVAAWEGRQNLLWRVTADGHDAVVKLYLDAGQARGRRQYDGQSLFSPLGIAPPPLWFDRYPTGLARQVLVYHWAPGATLAGDDSAQLAQLAQVVAQVHRGDPAEVRRFCPNPVNLDYLWRVIAGGLPPIQQWLAAQPATAFQSLFSQLTANAQALVEATLPLWQQVAPTPVHGDLRLENAVYGLGTVQLLDWELFGLGDPAYDVAAFLQQSQTALSDDASVMWLEHYLAHFEQPNLAQRIGVYQRIMPLQSVCYLLDGLRHYVTSDPTSIRENRTMLAATLDAAFAQTMAALSIDSNKYSTVIAEFLDQLM